MQNDQRFAISGFYIQDLPKKSKFLKIRLISAFVPRMAGRLVCNLFKSETGLISENFALFALCLAWFNYSSLQT